MLALERLQVLDAMRNFDSESTATTSNDGLNELARDRRVSPDHPKLAAIVRKVQPMIHLDEAHGCSQKYMRTQVGFALSVTDPLERLKFPGDVGRKHFLHVVAESAASRGR